MLFSKIDGLSDLQALRLPPPTSLGNPRQERAQQEMKKPRAPFWEDDEKEEEEEEGLFKADAVN